MPLLCDYFSHDLLACGRIADTDIPEAVELINRAYSYQDQHRSEKRTSYDHLKKLIDESEFYVFRAGGKIVACVYIEPGDTAEAYFGLLTVDEAYRGQDIGRQIVEATESYAKSLGINSLKLAYMHIAPWLKLYYESMGYTETGEVWDWDGISLINMSKHL